MEKQINVLSIMEAINKVKKEGKSCFSHFCVEFVKSNFEKDMLIDETKKVYLRLLEGKNT